MTSHNIEFIKARSRRLAEQARQYPRTCTMARGYLNVVFHYARRARNLDLMEFALELENSILATRVAA